MKAKEHILNLKTVFGAVSSEISGMTDKHLMFVLDSARAELAAQKMQSNVNVTSMSQFVDITVEQSLVSEVGTIQGVQALKIDPPKLIQYMGGEGVFTVGPTDGQDSYSRIDFSQLRTAIYRKYTGSSPKWFFLDNSMYIINLEPLGALSIRVRGIFDEPYLVEKAMGRLKRLDPWNFEYPLSKKDVKTVYQLAMQAELGWGDSAISALNSKAKKSKDDNDLLSALKNIGNAKG